MQLKPSETLISLMDSFQSLTGYRIAIADTISEKSLLDDEVLMRSFRNLVDYPVDKWVALCDALEPSAILTTATSYCNGFDWSKLTVCLLRLKEIGEPLSDIYLAAQYLNRDAYRLLFVDNIAKFSLLAETNLPIDIVKYLFSGIDCIEYDVPPQQLELLNPCIAKIVIWDWIRRGVPGGFEDVIEIWSETFSNDISLKFWCAFASIFRLKRNIMDFNQLLELAQNARQRQLVNYLSHAIKKGPMTPADLLVLRKNLKSGDTTVQWQRFLRLAYWLAPQAPLAVVGSPTRQFEIDVQMLEKNIDYILKEKIS